MSSNCHNCEHPIDAAFTYCPGCGQKTDTRRLRMLEIIGDFWTQLTDIDRGFFTLIRSLAVRPGIVAREYIEGKRKKHFGPLNFYLIVGTLLILSMNLTEWINTERAKSFPSTVASPKVNEQLSVETPSVQTEGKAVTTPGATMREKINARRKIVMEFWKKYSDIVSIGAAPLLCFFLWLFYRSAGFNYTELLVACFYMFGFTNLVYAIVVSPISSTFVAAGAHTGNYLTTGLFKLFEVIYIAFACYQLTVGRLRRPLFRAGIVSTLVTVFWVAFTFAIMSAYIMTGFGID